MRLLELFHSQTHTPSVNEADTTVWYHGTPELQNFTKFENRTLSVSYITDPDQWKAIQAQIAQMPLMTGQDRPPKYWDLLDAIAKLTQFKKVRSPVFLTNNRSVAKTYADDKLAFDHQAAVPGIIPVHVQPGKTLTINGRGQNFRGISIDSVRQGLRSAGIQQDQIDHALAQFANQVRGDGNRISTDSLAAIVDEFGFDIVDVVGIQDNYMGGGPAATVRMVMSPGLIDVIRNEMADHTLYHGAPRKITGRMYSQDNKFHPSGIGIWFTENPEVAKYIGRSAQRMVDDNPVLVTASIDLNKMKSYDTYQDFLADFDNYNGNKQMRTALIRQGYDGIVIEQSDTDLLYDTVIRRDYAVFDPKRIRIVSQDPISESQLEWGGCWVKPNGEVLHLEPNPMEPIHHAEFVFDDPELDAIVDQRLEDEDDADSREIAVEVGLEHGWIRVRTHARGTGELVIQFDHPPTRQAKRELRDYITVHRGSGRFFMNSRKFNSAEEMIQALG